MNPFDPFNPFNPERPLDPETRKMVFETIFGKPRTLPIIPPPPPTINPNAPIDRKTYIKYILKDLFSRRNLPYLIGGGIGAPIGFALAYYGIPKFREFMFNNFGPILNPIKDFFDRFSIPLVPRPREESTNEPLPLSNQPLNIPQIPPAVPYITS
jgi:hypothetical protein